MSDMDVGDRWVLVDGSNVIGSVPDGWWRDRPAAARRLLGRLRCYAGATGEAVTLVLDVDHGDLPAGDHGGVEVRYARRRGRDAADDEIVALVSSAAGARPALVITSDRGLAARAAGHAAVLGAKAFRDRLERRGC